MTAETAESESSAAQVVWYRLALHVGFAAVLAALVSALALIVTAPFVLLGAGAYIAALLVVVGGMFALAGFSGFLFSRSRAAWFVAPIGMVPALAIPVATLGSESGAVNSVIAVLAAVASVLVLYPRVTRIVGAVLAVLTLIGGGVVSDSGGVSEAGFPSTLRPQVTQVHGYVEVGALPTPLHGVVVEYAATKGEKRFTLSTEPIVESDTAADIDQVCMIPLDLTDYDAESDAISCEVTPNGWQKISATRRELSEQRGPMIVRAGSDLSVDISVLRAALYNAEDASSRQYREFLKESRTGE